MARPTVSALLLAGVVLAVFAGSLTHEFVWDDVANISGNPHLTPPSLDGLARFWRAPYESLYIPATYSAWWLLSIPGHRTDPLTARPVPDSRVFHAANILLHALNALLVFSILRRLCAGSRRAAPSMGPVLGALFFALHPLQVESVAWVTGMKDLLAGLFCLLAIDLYLPFAAGAPHAGSRYRHRWSRACAATGAFVFALLSKPSAVALPVIAWALACLLRRPTAAAARPEDRAVSWLRRQAVLLGWLAVALGWVVVTKRIQPDTLVRFVTPFALRPVVAADSIAFYLYKLVLPVRLLPDYGRAPAWLLSQRWAYFTAAVPAGLAALAWRRRVRWPWLWGATVVFVAAVLPVAGFVPFGFQDISTVADRYAYLALLGPAVALACWLAERGDRPRTVWIWGGAIACLGLLSALQTRKWRDNERLFAYVAERNPRSTVAHVNLGLLHFAQGRLAEAMAHYRAALARNPRDVTALTNMGGALSVAGRTEEACTYYRRALAEEPGDVKANSNLGLALAEQGRFDEALAHYSRALQTNASDYSANYNLANAYADMGYHLEALAHYSAALCANPFSPQANNNVALVLAKEGRHEAALRHFSAALRADPRDAGTHCNIGTLLLQMGRLREARIHYLHALEILPDSAAARQGLAAIDAMPARHQPFPARPP